MKTTQLFLTVLLALIFQSCSAVSTGKKYSSSKQYQARAEIKKDYLNTEKQTLSSKDINSLLSKKVNLKRPLKIAVVKVAHLNELHTSPAAHNQFNTIRTMINSKNAKHFRDIQKNSKYIQDISLIPEFIKPDSDDFKSLRDVAALMQADLLLVIKTRSYTDYDFNFTKKNEAKAIATIEAVILDVRTGVIPFTSISTGEHLSKKGKEFSKYEFQIKASIAAEDKALGNLAKDITRYFN